MTVSAKVPNEHPLMIAWEEWKKTGDYENALKWARHMAVAERETNALVEVRHPHTEGSLWGAFVAGWNASSAHKGEAK